MTTEPSSDSNGHTSLMDKIISPVSTLLRPASGKILLATSYSIGLLLAVLVFNILYGYLSDDSTKLQAEVYRLKSDIEIRRQWLVSNQAKIERELERGKRNTASFAIPSSVDEAIALLRAALPADFNQDISFSQPSFHEFSTHLSFSSHLQLQQLRALRRSIIASCQLCLFELMQLDRINDHEYHGVMLITLYIPDLSPAPSRQ